MNTKGAFISALSGIDSGIFESERVLLLLTTETLNFQKIKGEQNVVNYQSRCEGHLDIPRVRIS